MREKEVRAGPCPLRQESGWALHEVYLSGRGRCAGQTCASTFWEVCLCGIKMAPGKKPRSLQIRRMKQITALGIPCYVIDAKEQIGGVIDAISSP